MKVKRVDWNTSTRRAHCTGKTRSRVRCPLVVLATGMTALFPVLFFAQLLRQFADLGGLHGHDVLEQIPCDGIFFT